MKLKRIYDHDAPRKNWTVRQEACAECGGKGVVVNEAGDGVEQCPTCGGDGLSNVDIPPIIGVEVLHAGPVQHFSTRIVHQGQEQGWISITGDRLVLTGSNRVLTYEIVQYPWPVGDEREVTYYDTKLIDDEEVNHG